MNRMIGYAAVCAAVFVLPAKADTIYNYVGTPLQCQIPGAICVVPVRLTGSVTFDFDTTDFTGVIDKNSGDISAIHILGITDFGVESFTFDHAAIVAWSLAENTRIDPVRSSSGDGDIITGTPCGNPTCFFAATSLVPGTWTPVGLAAPVPGPVAGAGLPGLVLAVGGFLTWRRRRYG